MASDAFPHNLRVLFQTAAHGTRLRNAIAKATMTSSGKCVNELNECWDLVFHAFI
jgi:hypothetical protein